MEEQAVQYCIKRLQMTTEYFSFTELSIKPSDIEELMGFEPGNSPAPFPELIGTGLERAAQLCRIIGGYILFDNFSVDSHTESFTIKDQVFFPGKTIFDNLKKATKAAIFLCTAGPEISELASKMATEGEELMAYVLDVTGSVAVNKIAGLLQERIKEEVSPSGYGITDPCSPGYCSWNLAEQQKLFTLLPEGFCNVTLSNLSIMHPVKSLSGVTGIGTNCQHTGIQCGWCNARSCIYGKTRHHKKAKKKL